MFTFGKKARNSEIQLAPIDPIEIPESQLHIHSGSDCCKLTCQARSARGGPRDEAPKNPIETCAPTP
jgi:hypothetical protein